MEFPNELKDAALKGIDDKYRKYAKKTIAEYEKVISYIESKSFIVKPEGSRLPVEVINVEDAMEVFRMGLDAVTNIMEEKS